MKSLRRQLLLSLMTALLGASVIVAAATYRQAKEEIDEMFDANLAQIANTLNAGQSSGTHPIMAEFPNATQVASEADFIIQLWNSKDALEYSSHPRIGFPLQKQQEWSTVLYRGEKWRVYKKQTDGNAVQVAQRLKDRMDTIEEVVEAILVPQLVFIPIFGLFIWVLVGRSMRPLGWISSLIAKRGPNALEPIETEHVPIEINPLVTALNRLMFQLSEALTIQREFTADAAHELRTPLTALKLQLNTLEQARNNEERKTAIADCKSGVERATRLIQQLLTMARMEPVDTGTADTIVDLVDLIKKSVLQFIVLAEDKQIDLGIQHLTDATVSGDAKALGILLGNVLDNAIRYTPSGGKIDINLIQEHNIVRLDVEDSGPGIPEEQYERVFDRFYRAAPSEIPGTGLGLAIVKAIAEKHKTSVTLGRAALGGLKVSFLLPLTSY